ncbi:hypothetical protein [Pseudolactococcus piscium]|uniref:hypothetical protein n=1 Tax=Pseudolactococcus piscium TaxID=1364 RepID=UPI000BDF56C7|nr:hypothetical protein [Lactococcus piscium]
MIDEIVGQAKSNQGKRNDLTSGSSEPEVKNERTNVKLAELANTSTATVQRMKKVKKESPELYEQVVKGEKSITVTRVFINLGKKSVYAQKRVTWK